MRSLARLAPALPSIVLTVSLHAQTAWTKRAPAASPAARSDHAMAYDAQRGRVVLFGGNVQGVGTSNDTWEWDGAAWVQRLVTPSPPARGAHAMVYDSARARVVLFGGVWPNVASYNDTWEWDGAVWSQRNPPSSPRATGTMAYDSARQRAVLLGGGSLYETWEWDGSNWLQRFPVTSPSSSGWLAYDSRRRKVVLFCGLGYISPQPGQTWEWDGANWTQLAPATAPAGRVGSPLAYDSLRGRCVMFGGANLQSLNVVYLQDTQEWDGVTWTDRTSGGPQPRNFHALADDSMRGKVVMFGGFASGGAVLFGDTWEYGPVNPAVVTPFGTGCAVGLAAPVLSGDAGSLPWLGDTFAARLDNLGSNPANAPFLLLGDSKTQWGGLVLPLSLGPLGMPGCTLYTSVLVAIAQSNVGGSAAWPIAIPSVAAYAGLSAYAQGALMVQGANPLGVVVSNACELRLGGK